MPDFLSGSLLVSYSSAKPSDIISLISLLHSDSAFGGFILLFQCDVIISDVVLKKEIILT